jgi:hypothetical protein
MRELSDNIFAGDSDAGISGGLVPGDEGKPLDEQPRIIRTNPDKIMWR